MAIGDETCGEEVVNGVRYDDGQPAMLPPA